MIGVVLGFFKFLFGIWAGLPNSTKEKIISVIVDNFEVIFKKFYNDYQDAQKDEDEKWAMKLNQ